METSNTKGATEATTPGAKTDKKRVLSCIQPTGSMHFGNYLGAIKNWVDLQDKYDCVYGVVDLHAMTMPYDPATLKKNTFDLYVQLLSVGVTIEKCTLFIQSLVPEHTELSWILSCVTSYGQLTRMTQFKDKSQQLQEKTKDDFISAGLFSYPVLQAADIIVYKADLVPVGKDQEQHLELARNIAGRFNNQFGEYFAEPQPLFTEVPKLLSLADPTKKMSSSLGPKHYVSLFEDPKTLQKKVKSAVTDTGEQQGEGVEMSPGVANLFTLLKACDKMDKYNEFLEEYNKATLKYGYLKVAAAEALAEQVTMFRARRDELLSKPKQVEEMMYSESAEARAIAQKTLNEVKDLTGIFR